MGKQFEFADFVDEFKVSFMLEELQKTDGYYDDDGEWVLGGTDAVPIVKEGIVLPLSEDDLKYAENGVYSVREKKLYTVFEIPFESIVIYKGDKYTVQAFKDYSEYADVFIYLMRWRKK